MFNHKYSSNNTKLQEIIPDTSVSLLTPTKTGRKHPIFSKSVHICQFHTHATHTLIFNAV